jgi:hypothetical protein
MRRKTPQHNWHWLVGLLLAGALLMAGLLGNWLHRDVVRSCQYARSTYSGDCVEALAQLVLNEQEGYRTRNDAVFALGQIADPRALPALQQLYTGMIPEREPLDSTLSQYELRKAIRWCREGNGTSWLYRMWPV